LDAVALIKEFFRALDGGHNRFEAGSGIGPAASQRLIDGIAAVRRAIGFLQQQRQIVEAEVVLSAVVVEPANGTPLLVRQ
jgi:ABC-type phosphate/phosphonate transport system ATPase subunit